MFTSDGTQVSLTASPPVPPASVGARNHGWLGPCWAPLGPWSCRLNPLAGTFTRGRLMLAQGSAQPQWLQAVRSARLERAAERGRVHNSNQLDARCALQANDCPIAHGFSSPCRSAQAAE